jgi:phosphoglycolate phosphatase
MLARMSAPVVVGFDLDMTLIDARVGIAATYRALVARTGVHVDVDTVVARIGLPLRQELANWFPPDEVEAAVRGYRALYPAYLNDSCAMMPGADVAVAAVRRHGGRVVVVTSKLDLFARAHLDHLGLVVDEVAGDRFGGGKTDAILDLGVGIYVGDHVADMRAARAAGATAVGVATGPHTEVELAAAGGDPVLPDLRSFPAWLATRLTTAATAEDARTGTG